MKFSVRIAGKPTKILNGFLQKYDSSVAAVSSCSVC